MVLGATLKPASTMQFFVTPGEEARLQWKVEGGPLAEPLEYVLRDYSGSSTGVSPVSAVGSGRAKITSGGTGVSPVPEASTGKMPVPPGSVVEVTLSLRQGFYEIEFPATKQRFGIVSLPAWKGKADPFFCIDGALSWLVHDDAIREGLVQAARRSGIRMIRERLRWGAANPAPDRWDWQTNDHYDTLRQACRKHGVEVLEMAHDSPRWMGHTGPRYPADLVATARSWQKIAEKWQPTWGGMEIWNEPDIMFGGNLPADQYAAIVKAVSSGSSQAKIQVPVVGGVMAGFRRPFLDTAARNGILDNIDAFSFHTYGRATEMEGLVEKYRTWLKEYGHEAKPLWITECGRPWKTGPERPPVDQDAESALDITMKAVEAKACGIARYFAFVYPFYEEGKNNFGMMDKRATPLRSFAAYVQVARVIAGHRYAGDVKVDDKRILRARLFGSKDWDPYDDRIVAVFYTGRVDPNAAVKIDLPPQRIEGIDGRELKPTASGAIPVPDGMVYIWCRRGDLPVRTDGKKSTTADLPATVRPELPVARTAPLPIILRYQWDDKLLQPTADGYRFRGEVPKKMPIAVRVFNLAEEPRDLTLRLRFHEQEPAVVGPNPRPVKLPAEGFADVSWEMGLGTALTQSKALRVIVTAEGGAETCLTTLDFELMAPK
jgi:hypothetical protein